MKARAPYRFEIAAWASGVNRQIARSGRANFHLAAQAVGVPKRLRKTVVEFAKSNS